MKFVHLVTAAAFAFGATAFAAEKKDPSDHHEPMYGGVVAPGKHMDYELVAKPDSLQLYLRDHGKLMDSGKASAKVTLLYGAEKQDVQLKPAGDKLEAKGSFKVGAGTKAVAQVTVGGKTSTARFVLK
jgi:hypothetical protein